MEEMVNECKRLAGILNGKSMREDGVCMVIRERKDLHVTIDTKPFHSVSHMIEFEPADVSGNSLITGEIVLQEHEVTKTARKLKDAGIIISSIHAHWLFDKPKLIYLHFETNMNPIHFARILSPILDDLH